MATVFISTMRIQTRLKVRRSPLWDTAAKGTRRRHRTCAIAGTRSLSGWTRIVASAKKAKADGFSVYPRRKLRSARAGFRSLTPDETQGELYESAIEAAPDCGKILGVSHGFQHSLQNSCPTQRRRRRDDCAEESGTFGPPRIQPRARVVPSASGNSSGCERKSA